MTDASKFATQHAAFWSDHTPTSEHFVRRLNLAYTDRWEPPLRKPGSAIRAAFVAEFAFALFCDAAQGLPDDAQESASETRRRLIAVGVDPASLEEPLSEEEQQQVSALNKRLAQFFDSREAGIIVRPRFWGCGFIDASEGDVICGTTLFEVKAVDRPFRSADLRQLITYCALNRLSRQYDLATVGVYNPRRGLFFEMDIERLSHEMAGISAQELFSNVVHVFSSGEISR